MISKYAFTSTSRIDTSNKMFRSILTLVTLDYIVEAQVDLRGDLLHAD